MFMQNSKIKANFYTIDGYKLDGTKYELPDNRLYSGWGSRHPTKITPADLPEWYVLMTNYKKHGYLSTRGIKNIYYSPNIFDNHWLKDAFLYISYDDGIKINETSHIICGENFNESIFGNDILNALFGIEKYSPNIDTAPAWNGILNDYNKYARHENKWRTYDNTKPIYISVKDMIDGLELRKYHDEISVRKP